MCFVVQNEFEIDFEDAANLIGVMRTEINEKMTKIPGVDL
jgi:hypothetical protein